MRAKANARRIPTSFFKEKLDMLVEILKRTLGQVRNNLGKAGRQSSRLQGRLDGHSTLALADSASCSNFMAEAYAS